jgi:transcriptional regulator with XRE-family HTH domain
LEEAARQLIRAMRGRRSQVALSRRLGYRGNVAAKWEGGQRSPTFGEILRAFARLGVDVPEALRRFHAPSASAWDPERPEEIAAWLRALQGQTPQALIAERAGLSRQQVGRLMSGRTQGRLPMVMSVIDALTGRLPDLVGALVPIEQVPELARKSNVRQALSRLAFAHPWSPAAQAWLGSRGEVRASSAAQQLSRDLALELPQATELVEALVEAGVAEISRGKLRPAPSTTVEISATDEDIKRLRAHWASVSASRMARQAPGDLFSFNVFAVSREDLAKIHQSQRRFYREVRAIVAESPPEVVALLVIHTAALAEPADPEMIQVQR